MESETKAQRDPPEETGDFCSDCQIKTPAEAEQERKLEKWLKNFNDGD